MICISIIDDWRCCCQYAYCWERYKQYKVLDFWFINFVFQSTIIGNRWSSPGWGLARYGYDSNRQYRLQVCCRWHRPSAGAFPVIHSFSLALLLVSCSMVVVRLWTPRVAVAIVARASQHPILMPWADKSWRPPCPMRRRGRAPHPSVPARAKNTPCCTTSTQTQTRAVASLSVVIALPNRLESCR